MKAAVIHEHGGLDRLVVEEFAEPTMGPTDVLIEVKACALNYLDIFTRRGMPGIKVPMPMITGGDIAGAVLEVGARVEGWAAGDRVLVYPIARGRGMYGETIPGGLCERIAVPADLLMRIPDAVSFERAAALPVAYGTALRMLITRGKVAAGERVLVLGASGGVGTGAVQIAKMLGAEVVACASSAAKAERLKALGADHVIDYVKEDLVEACAVKYGRRAMDVAVNFTGGDTWVQSLRTLKLRGRQLTCGATAGYDPKTDIRFIWTFELEIIGSNGWSRKDQAQLLELVADGKIDPVIDRVMPLTEIVEAERLIEDREAFGKIVIRP